MKPLFGWVGAKNWLWKRIKDILIEDKHNTYIEPFLGGGAIAWNLMKYCDEHNINKRFILSDANPELMNFYKCLKFYPEELIAELDELWNSPETFYDIRDKYNEVMGKLPDFLHINRAAMFLYIMKCGYRKLWRINKNGKLTTPKGFRVNKLYEKEHLMEASRLLRKYAELQTCEFTEHRESGLYYLDPPYVDTFDQYCTAETVTNERLNNFITSLNNSTVFISNNERYIPPPGSDQILKVSVGEKMRPNVDKTRKELLWCYNCAIPSKKEENRDKSDRANLDK